MPLPFMGCSGGLVMLPDPVGAVDWSLAGGISGADRSTSDVAINFSVGARRNLRASKSNVSLTVLYYRINSGSWVQYLGDSAGPGDLITITPGQTLGWRVVFDIGDSVTSSVTIRDDARGEIIDTFTAQYAPT